MPKRTPDEAAHDALIKDLDQMREDHKDRMAPVGWFCHKWDGDEPGKGVIERQGKVIGQPQIGYVLIQWYSWLTAETTFATLVPITELGKYTFYANIETWRHYGDTHQPKGKQ